MNLASSRLNGNRLCAFVTSLFAAFEESSIPYVVLRNYEGLPYRIEGDIDLLVGREHATFAERVIRRVAQENGLSLVNRAEFSPTCLHFADLDTLEQIQIDVFSALKWRVFEILDARSVLESRRRFRTFYVPAETDEAALSVITRLLYGQPIREAYVRRLLEAVERHEASMFAKLSGSIGSGAATMIVDCARNANLESLMQRARQLRAHVLGFQLRQSAQLLLSNAVRDAARLLKRWIRPPGLCIVLRFEPDLTDEFAKSLAALLEYTFREPKIRRARVGFLELLKSWPLLFRNHLVLACGFTSPPRLRSDVVLRLDQDLSFCQESDNRKTESTSELRSAEAARLIFRYLVLRTVRRHGE
mgnify:CR=1 FL=1